MNSNTDLFGKDLYSLLEVSPSASPEVIAAAHKAILRKNNYDSNPMLVERAKDLNAARDLLCDARLRRDYDNERLNRPGKMVGPYKLLEVISEGAFAVTYKAEHTILKELVCVKYRMPEEPGKVDPIVEEILVNEARAMWNLRHYSIPVLRDMVRMPDKSVALVMSYIPGKTLEQYVTEVGRLSFRSCAWILERCLNALKYVHYHTIIHGDVKPSNLIVQEQTHQAILVDFGLALRNPNRRSTSVGFTKVFSPPEQIEGGKPLLPESDLYSLGMTILFALSASLDRVKNKQIPVDVPKPFADFLRDLTKESVLDRLSWETGDLVDIFSDIRLKCFGTRHSEMEPITGR